MAAHPTHQVASPPSGWTDWQWLRCAAEMAAEATGTAELRPAALTAPDWTCFPRIAMRTHEPVPGFVSSARRFTADTISRWGASGREDDIAVVVSELLSNALRHGSAPLPPGAATLPATQPIQLGLVCAGPAILCAVADGSEAVPVPRDPSWLDESGRGLHVIDSLSDGWGSCVDPARTGKVVWAAFATIR